MAYYFAVKTNGEYKFLDLSEHPDFVRISRHKGNKFSLEEIDRFTSSSANELALRLKLYFGSIMNEDDLYNEICIVFRYKGKFLKVENIAYDGFMDYLNPICLNYRVKSLIYGDKIFANIFLSKYGKIFFYYDIIHSIMEYINGCGNPELDRNDLIDDFFNRSIYERRDNPDTEISIRYKALRDLVMIVYNYNHAPDMNREEIYLTLGEYLDNFRNSSNGYNANNKKIVKVRRPPRVLSKKSIGKRNSDVLDGQTSFLNG